MVLVYHLLIVRSHPFYLRRSPRPFVVGFLDNWLLPVTALLLPLFSFPLSPSQSNCHVHSIVTVRLLRRACRFSISSQHHVNPRYWQPKTANGRQPRNLGCTAISICQTYVLSTLLVRAQIASFARPLHTSFVFVSADIATNHSSRPTGSHNATPVGEW